MAFDPNSIVRLEKRKQLVKAAKPKKRLRRAPRWLQPMSIEREYQNILVQYVNEMLLAAREILLPALPGLVNEADQSRPKTDSYADNLEQMMQALSLGIDRRITKNWQTVTLDIGQKTSKWNSGQWQKSIKSVMGINAAQYEPWLQDQLLSFGKENVGLIKSIKDKSLSTIESNAQRAIRSGLRHEAIAQQIEDEFNTTKARARLIARDQVSKLNGQLTQLRQNDIGIKEYIWRTSGDERVRASHAIMDGKRCRWDDPTVYFDGKAWVPRPSSAVQEHPGQDYQCRCWAEPVFDKLYEDIDLGREAPVGPVEKDVEKLPVGTMLRALSTDFLFTSKVATPDIKDHVDFVALVKKRKLANSSYLSDTHGMSKGGRGCNIKTLQVVAERATWYKENLNVNVNVFQYTGVKGHYASLGQGVFNIGAIRNFEKSSKSLSANESMGYHPVKCGTIKSVVDHEYGHAIYDKYLKGKMKGSELSLYYQGLSAREISKGLSIYGKTNFNEFIAEGWSEFTNNPDPRPMAKNIGKLVIKMIGAI